MASNDKRIEKSYTREIYGGYISINKIDVDEDAEFRCELIYNKIGKLSNLKELWVTMLSKYKSFIILNQKIPQYRLINCEERTLHLWKNCQKSHYGCRTGPMKYQDIYDMWTEFINSDLYLIYTKDPIRRWKNLLAESLEYIDIYHIRPHNKKNTELDPYITKLKKFLCDNINHFDNENEEIICMWNNAKKDIKYANFLTSNEEKWKNNFNALVKYENDHGCFPDPDNYLSSWKTEQHRKYKNQKNGIVVTNPIISKLWTGMIYNVKYERYFNKEKRWIYSMNLVYQYIEINKRLPITNHTEDQNEKICFNWIGAQSKNYKNEKKAMKNPKLRILWEEFIMLKKKNNLIPKPGRKPLNN